MRPLTIMLAIFALAINAFAIEDTLSLDRCQIINHETDRSMPSKLLIHFMLPERMSGREIILAEITSRATLRNIQRDSLLELYFHPFLAQPPENNADYDALEEITDSLGAGAWTCRFDSALSFRVDITGYMREVAGGDRINYGLIGALDLLGENNIVVPEKLAEAIRDHARVRILYK